MKKTTFINVILFVVSVLTLCSCNNHKRNMLWDSGPIENVRHGGTFVGYSWVYTIDWLYDTKTISPEQYRVYRKSDGNYIIDYKGTNYILSKASTPYGSGPYSLKWKFSHDHYIEDIPCSY